MTGWQETMLHCSAMYTLRTTITHLYVLRLRTSHLVYAHTHTHTHQFIIKGLLGFFAGAGDFGVYVAPLLVQCVIPISLWFGLLNTHGIPPLTVLGIAYGVAPWVTAACFFAYLFFRKSLQRTFQLRLLCCGRSNSTGECDHLEGGDADDVSIRSLLRTVAMEGGQLMVVDLAVQLSITITIYVAAHEHFETAYKIAAAQAAYWKWGPQYLVGTMVIMKVIGAKLVASGKTQQFAGLFGFATFVSVGVACAAIVGAAVYGPLVAHNYGQVCTTSR